MKHVRWLALTLCLPCGCDGGGGGGTITSGSPMPLLVANGTASVAGSPVMLAYGASNVFPDSGTVQIAISDVEMNCSTFAINHPPDHGTFVSVQVPSAEPGVASKDFVTFNVFVNGDYADVGGGSNAGTVEVLEATSSAITVRVAYRDTIQDAELVLDGDFGVGRCP